MTTEALAGCGDVRAVDDDDLRAPQLLRAAVDSPWVHLVDRAACERTLLGVRALAPSAVLSSHLPPALHGADELLETRRLAPSAEPFSCPDQRASEEMLVGFAPG